MGGSNSKNKKSTKPISIKSNREVTNDQPKLSVLNTTVNDTRNGKSGVLTDIEGSLKQKPKGSVIDSKIPESNNIGSQREMGNIIQTDQTNEYEQIIKESLREMEENQIDENILQELLLESPGKDASTVRYQNFSKATKIVTQDGIQRHGKLPPLNSNYKPQIKYPILSHPPELSVKIADQTEDLENSFEYNAYEFRNTYKSRPDRSDENSEFDYTLENRFKQTSGLNNAQINHLELSKHPSMTQTQRNDQFPLMIFIRDDQSNMDSLQKSRPFQIKHQNGSFAPIVDETDESYDRYGGTKDRHLDQPRGGRMPKHQQSYDDSDFKNSLKSDEFYTTEKSNAFGVRRRSIDFAYGNQLGNIELSEDDKPSSLENEPNDREDCKQNNNYSDQLNELIDNDSDDEFEYYHKEKSHNIQHSNQGNKLGLRKDSYKKII